MLLAKCKDKIEDEILIHLLNPNKDYWDITLLFELAFILVKNGNNKAKKAIYLRYSKNLIDCYELVEPDVLVILDGLKGLEFVAKIEGKMIEQDSSYWIDDHILEICKKYHPASSPIDYLKEKSKSNKYIKIFISELEDIKSLNDEKKRTSITKSLSELLELIDEGKSIPIISGKWLNDSEILVIANLLLEEKDDEKIKSYLRLLKWTKYPLEISSLLGLLQTNNENIKHSTLQLFKQIKNQRIRDLIENNYTNLSFLYSHLELFVSNFLEKDICVLCDILDTLRDEDSIHDFALIIMDIFDNNEIKNRTKLLNKLYSIGNCSLCRKSFINRLIESKELSKDILKEIKYDCEPDIRKIANTYIKDNDNSCDSLPT